MQPLTTADFETDAIENRPWYPPKPVGLALRHPDRTKEYLAWGHPTENNCDMATARAKLRDAYKAGPVLFHNGTFDLDVAEIFMGLKPPENIEDSLFLAFLKNPHEQALALKPLGEKYLHMPPEEQNVLRDWIVENVPEAHRRPKQWGEFICKAPGGIVGDYAIGDVDRTYKLWKKFRPEISRRGMDEAYTRELALIPTTLEMERSGIRVGVPALRKAQRIFEKLDAELLRRIRKRLRVSEAVNINSGPQLAKALAAAGKLTAIVKTKTGRQSTKISVLHETCSDKQLLDMLAVHSVAEKYLSTFIRPWLEQAAYTDGRVLPGFNQVRSDHGGTRSGRFSSDSPNLQTVTANVMDSKNREVLMMMQRWLKEEYQYDFIGLRDFFLPDEGSIICAVDYNQQELRLLAHFERGVLWKAYNENPKLDVHEYFRQLIHQKIGILYERKAVKILVFGLIYGMGVKKLALSIGVPLDVAKELQAGLFAVAPTIQDLMKKLKKLGRDDKALRTWGGREYYCRDPMTIEDDVTGERYLKTFEYQLLNYLIQPSAADVTKQGMIQVRERVPQARIAIQVHDEVITMVPDKSYGPRIAHAMCDMKFNVPMLADVKYSEETWARVE